MAHLQPLPEACQGRRLDEMLSNILLLVSEGETRMLQMLYNWSREIIKLQVQLKFSGDFINTISETHQMLKDSSMRAGSSVSSSSSEVSELQRPLTACRHDSLPAIGSSQTDNKGIGKDGGNILPSGVQRSKEEVPQQREFKSSQSLQMKAVALTEGLNPIPPAVPTSSVLHGATPKLDQHLKTVSCSGQIPAEQELCFLCTQRALRNVPEYRQEQRDTEEKAHGNLLLLKEQLRDAQEMEQELAKLTEQREQGKKVSVFNLHMSRREKSSCFDCPRSFVFPTRPVTPRKRTQQHRYRSDLRRQMEQTQKLVVQDQQYCLLTEQLDQMQLIQEIALQRTQQLQKKLEKTKHYRKALDAQVEDKMFTSCPECSPDKPRLTRCETAIRRAESRKRAQKLFQANFGVATQRKREEMQSRQLQLENEKEMLKHTKTELIRDNINHFEKKRAVRKSLEDDWSRSIELKHKREDEERRFLRSAGKLLVDKLEECQRCWRCKRRTTNCGETNIWKDSCYLSGSQFMI